MSDGNRRLAHRLLTNELRDAASSSDDERIAKCHHLFGNLAEIERRTGDAFRAWSTALGIYRRIGVSGGADVERLEFLLRVWHEHQRVFVSYAWADEALVEPVLAGARAAGVELVMDKSFLAGHSIERQIRRAIERCPKFLAFFSAEYARRSWTAFELALYREKMAQDRAAAAEDCSIVFFCLPGWNAAASVLEEFEFAVMIDSSRDPQRANEQLVRALTTSCLDGR